MDPITDSVVGSVVGIAGKVLDKIFPDPIAQANARLELLKLQQSGELEAMANDVKLAQMQSDVNVQEAKSGNIFIAGWRPFVGWVCGVGFGIQVLGPLLQWTAALFGKSVIFPELDFSIMAPTLAAMLGIGGMRTFEKFKNVEGNR
jgi:hypothetical protein